MGFYIYLVLVFKHVSSEGRFQCQNPKLIKQHLDVFTYSNFFVLLDFLSSRRNYSQSISINHFFVALPAPPLPISYQQQPPASHLVWQQPECSLQLVIYIQSQPKTVHYIFPISLFRKSVLICPILLWYLANLHQHHSSQLVAKLQVLCWLSQLSTLYQLYHKPPGHDNHEVSSGTLSIEHNAHTV